MCRARAVVAALASVLVVFAAAHARAADDPLEACQTGLARASRQLEDAIRREVGKCIAAGVRCLTASGSAPAACCDAVAPRCHTRDRKVAQLRQRFAERLAGGRCARVPFAVILDADGFGYESAAQACRCLPPPIDVTNLRSLAVCLGRLIDAETTRLFAVAEAPRAAEALACVGLDRRLEALAAPAAAAACGAATPTPPAPTPTLPAPTSTASSAPPPSVGAPTATSSSSAPAVTSTAVATPAATVSGITAPTMTASPRPTRTSAASPPSQTPIPSTTPTPRRTVTPQPTSTVVAVCGNGIVEGGEECDRDAYDDSGCVEDVCTCDDFCDDAGGRLACRRDCTIDFSHCTAGGCEF